ncbi:toxin-antitoxin system, antitoxin component, ribbon-helix-helix domain protein [Catonella morbi ATCC 51271]|uniref:Toxin-antitoxin system, antitoxin component, ribbon-helix-helix domain protein n=1 Tax=Catonella morbi ATCC 51271 TaxID=592026 RepID=V2Y0P2_9FIRM|nr:GIY-YIG nuclease family protein [Catonella morbi]ESL02563.1 toxin-antitoxin system, antitoxin component, ribbon-helix-helix domain protein [Catonella morbi ATCC 51271]
MGKYDPLNQFLVSSEKDFVRLTFSEIENLLGQTLPHSAYTYKEWWANGGHSQAYAWLDAGYKVEEVNLGADIAVFSKKGKSAAKKALSAEVCGVFVNDGKVYGKAVSAESTMNVCGYTFTFIQDLIPDRNKDGNVIKYRPQDAYENKGSVELLHYGKGNFCRFRIEADGGAGVYLWVVDGQIIYIGETANLRQRFNAGYGNISPRNCYVGGQSTNCKMNKAVLGLFERGKIVSLYFYQTTDYKRVESELLNKIYTPYNVKDN